MDAKTASALGLRLLELEQRFESYCTLHEEELKEIRSTLKQLRAEMLALSRDVSAPDDAQAETAPKASADEGESLDGLPILAL